MPLPKDGEYYVTTTLLGSSEFNPETGETRQRDVNRRMIYRWPNEGPFVWLNYHMDEWTTEDERRLQVILKALQEGKP